MFPKNLFTAALMAAGIAVPVAAQTARDAQRPPCSAITFSGIAVGGDPLNLAIVAQTRDLEDHIATYPLRCAPNALLQVYACRGLGYFEKHNAYVVSWSATSFSVLTAIDLTVGRKDALVYINRKNFACRDKTPPSALPSDNYERFWKTQPVHR